MTTVIRSANLTVLHAWLCGGQSDIYGNQTEGIHDLDVYTAAGEENLIDPRTDTVDKERLKETVINCIEIFADDPTENDKGYLYYGDYYRFKMPSPKNLETLVDIIYDEQCAGWKDLKERRA